MTGTEQQQHRQDRQVRLARREFVRAHHPDTGGDPEVFWRGLQAFDRPGPGACGCGWCRCGPTATADADITALRQWIETEALADLRRALRRPDLAVQLDVKLSSKTSGRTR